MFCQWGKKMLCFAITAADLLFPPARWLLSMALKVSGLALLWLMLIVSLCLLQLLALPLRALQMARKALLRHLARSED